jgi:hypothetical protein
MCYRSVDCEFYVKVDVAQKKFKMQHVEPAIVAWLLLLEFFFNYCLEAQ